MQEQFKDRPESLRVMKRFSEFMAGSGLKYTGSVLSVAVSVLTSF